MSMIRPGLRTFLVVSAVLGCLAVTVAFIVRPGSPSAQAWLSGVALSGTATLAGLACGVRAIRVKDDTRSRITWLCFGGTALAWGFAEFSAAAYDVLLRREPPPFSLADVGFLVAGALLVAGLLRMTMPERNNAARARAVVDGLLISAAVLLVGWVSVLGPTVRLNETGFGDKMMLLVYPSGDIALITLATYLVLRTRGDGLKAVLPVEPIAAAVVVFGVADCAFAYLELIGEYRSGHVVDAGWLSAYTLLLIAAVMPQHRRGPESEVVPRQIGLLLPYFFIVVAITVSLVVPEITGIRDETTRWIQAGLILLMVVRQLFSMQENQTLATGLEHRVTERTQELEVSHKRFQALIENSSDVVMMVDREGRILYVSDSVARVFGVRPDIWLDSNIREWLDDASTQKMNEALATTAAQPLGTATLEALAVFPDGRRVTIENTVTNLLDDPAVRAIVVNSRDISERRQLEDELVHQAFHDSLTGLANRALFMDRVRHAMRRRVLGPETVGVLFLDLDGFKEVNDSLGHATGDALLVDVARRLTSCLRPGDTIARLGGDEFAILVEGALTSSEFLSVASRISDCLEAAIVIDGRDLFIRASIGIASAEVGSVTADQLIRNADLAMYRAKERQDGEPALYDPSMHSSLVERLALEAELRKAIADHHLQVHYQPTYVLETGDLVGVEALVRWPHAERGMVRPDLFIPIAEQTGLIHEIGRFVLREACFQGNEWARLAPSVPLSIGVNVSGKQLQRRDFADEVSEALAESGLPADQLVLEMTESVLMNDTDSTMATLKSLKAMGVRVAIDDFGTGYSSLSYLHRFPVDILKIDRSFVDRLSGVDAEDSLVQSIVQLGHTLQLETIAEGIEEHSQLQALRRLGCTMAQGYHFGRPGPADTVSKLVVEASAAVSPLPA
ncbi:putative bifunctional diguanylate cyclase/phosphodiesterase [Kineosporia succinea]|uniref:Diguanylate cyclase (GGDEF)-like protein/PAS domain S-box-containing protein n=1 Tax=Kineosporia succinea TaxID=84632 RepID=A0ABT9P0J7_9ACTN|nr:bifunctional diguanylate cyclase/phosphodiesterase [Kineosporia succinea]MDP9826204.1 diguanylate cyclase (GGDEF)-like protein/PAS domain S-box-containing protein [Kineosporia succinea]